MYYLPTSIILISFSICTLFYTIKKRKEKIEKKLYINEILIGLLFLSAGILFPFIFQFHSSNLPLRTLNFLWCFTSIFLVIELSIWFIYIIYNFSISKRNPEIMAERNYKNFCKEFEKNWIFDFKTDLKRKLLHLFTVFIIFFFWILGTFLENLKLLDPWGLDNYSFSYWLIVTIGFGFIIMFQIADLARLNAFYTLPKWAKSWYCKQMRINELDTFVASTPMVLSFVFFLFAPFPIFASVALITTGADAIAALIGKKFGKHKINKNSQKTIEGLIAGGIMTFMIVISISLIFYRLLPEKTNFLLIIYMASIATIIFILIDALIKDIDDNILNPLLTGLGIWIVLIF